MMKRFNLFRNISQTKISGGAFTDFRSNHNFKKDAVLPTKPYKLHKLEKGPATETTLTRDEVLKLYTKMNYIRRMETCASNLYKERQIRGFCHLYSGQEAIAVGVKHVMRDTDSLITAYRCHAWAYIMGIPVREVLCELTGRLHGNVHGKGGSMHMYTKNFFGGNGIVGAQCPLGAGIAFSFKYRGEDNVCFTLYGDGAANQGQLYESMNMAKLWNLPCIFVCENNGYGMGTSAERSSASTEYYTRGDYVPGIWVDAMDIASVIEATRYATNYCRSGQGPLVMEMATYRYHGHSMSDPGTSYRTREEIQEVRKHRDPITGFKDKIVSAGLCSEHELKEIEQSTKKEVEEDAAFAVKDAESPLDIIYSDVYLNTPNLSIRGTNPFMYVQPKHQTTVEFMKSFSK